MDAGLGEPKMKDNCRFHAGILLFDVRLVVFALMTEKSEIGFGIPDPSAAAEEGPGNVQCGNKP